MASVTFHRPSMAFDGGYKGRRRSATRLPTPASQSKRPVWRDARFSSALPRCSLSAERNRSNYRSRRLSCSRHCRRRPSQQQQPQRRALAISSNQQPSAAISSSSLSGALYTAPSHSECPSRRPLPEPHPRGVAPSRALDCMLIALDCMMIALDRTSGTAASSTSIRSRATCTTRARRASSCTRASRRRRCARWLQMAPDGSRWLQMATDGYRWLQMATDGYRWL